MGSIGGPVGSPAPFPISICIMFRDILRRMSLLTARLVVAWGIVACCQSCWADVEVNTLDGRVIAGAIDSRTDDNQLWLRYEAEGIVLTSGMAWAEIHSARIDGQSATLDVLRTYAENSVTPGPAAFLWEVGPPLPPHTELPRHRQPRVASIDAEARLANLDFTAERDGFELALAVVDEAGQEVPVRGSLLVRLQGEKNMHHTGRIRVENLQQWNLSVEPHDFVDGVALYPLPFREIGIQFDDQIRPDAQLYVRLGVFGQGNYSATVPVPLWDFNPFKDRLQMFDGSRFFPNERTHHTRQQLNNTPGIYQRTWRD